MNQNELKQLFHEKGIIEAGIKRANRKGVSLTDRYNRLKWINERISDVEEYNKHFTGNEDIDKY